jgi:hypothetical protein
MVSQSLGDRPVDSGVGIGTVRVDGQPHAPYTRVSRMHGIGEEAPTHLNA